MMMGSLGSALVSRLLPVMKRLKRIVVPYFDSLWYIRSYCLSFIMWRFHLT